MKSPDDATVFDAGMKRLYAMFSKDYSKEQVHGYFKALEDMHIECVLHGMKESARLETRFPAAAKIREYGITHRLKPETPQIPYKSKISGFSAETPFGLDAAALMRRWVNGELEGPKLYFAAVDLAEKYNLTEFGQVMMEDFNAKYANKVASL